MSNPTSEPHSGTQAVARAMTLDSLERLINRRIRIQLIDVRRPEAYWQSGQTIAGSLRIPSGSVGDHIETLDRHGIVVAICVHGHEVSQGAAAALRCSGFNAYYLEGGFEAVKSADVLPIVPIRTGEGT